MAYSQSQLDALEAAIAQGALQVQFADRRVIYHSLAEMMRLRDAMRAELGMSVNPSRMNRAITLVTGRGL